MERVAKLITQTFTGHDKNIPIGFARGGFQIFARPSTHVEDVALVIHEQRRWRVMFQDHLIRHGLETGPRFWRWAGLSPAGQGSGKGGGKVDGV